jgi:hypothetical protein
MSMKKLWLAPLALVCGAASASPDTLYMENGRRIRGELVSANASTIVFMQDDGNQTRARRVRVNRADVARIDFNDTDDFFGDDDLSTEGPFGSGTGRDLFIPANQRWTDTGVRLRAGETFRIDASGMVNWGPDRSDDPSGEVNSPYNANRPMPNRPGGALIARVGNGAPFFVGAGTQSFRASTTGQLFLGINDDYLQDNSGSFRVLVSR